MSTPTFAKTYNLIAYLAKHTESEGFEQIIDFINGSSVNYALTASLIIHTSCIKKFWTTTKVKTINDEFLSAKTTSWNEFSSTMASAIICLATNQKFNFSRYILLSLVKNIEAGVPFFMFPRFVQLLIDHQLGDMSHHKDIYDNPSLTKKVLANMKRVGTGFSRVVTPLFDNMLVPAAKEVVIDIKSTYKERIEKLEGRVDRLEEENMVLKELYNVYSKVDTAAPIAKPYRMDLEHPKKVLSMHDVNDEEPDEVEEVLEVVTAAKLITEVVTTARATTTAEATKVSVQRRRRGVVIQDPEKTTSTVVVHSEVQSKDKGKDINWNAVIEQFKRSERLNDAVMKYQALKRKPLTEAQAKKNMIIYLKNMAGYKMNYFKEMTYSEIRPLFEKHYNYNQAFLEEVNEEVTLLEKEVEVEGHKREDETLEKEITKKQKMDEEVEELKSHLQIVSNDDDDVYTEATLLASKIPIVDYKIHLKRNKPYFKIIRADGNHILLLSFNTLLKNFDREDLESLCKLVKERFKKTKPKNYTDDYLLKTLRTMSKQPDVEASVWSDQKGRYGLAKAKKILIIADIDEDVEINLEEAQVKPYRIDLEHLEKVLSMLDVDDKELTKVEEVLEVVTTAKLITEVVTTAGATTIAEATKASIPRRKRGVVIQDPEETTSTVVVHSKNFDREDLESLWKLVKERFEKIEPKNYTNDYLLKTLKTMFKRPDVEASVWRDQKGRYGLAKRYPLTHLTLEQMLNNVRHEVKEESEMSLELLKLVRRQLTEVYVPE
nr:hypothetical protein [Tanacetum cinerariifolium]